MQVDKVVLITGASAGIGEATARALVKEGAKVIAFARSAGKLAVLANELGDVCLPIAGDVTKQADLDRAVAQGLDKFGRLDAVFANAGVFVQGSLAETDPDVWEKLIGVNVMGVLRTIRAALPTLVAQKSGHILLCGSISERAVYPGSAVYESTKHAVHAIAAGLRKEVYAQGVSVGVVSPGYTLSDIWAAGRGEASRAQEAEQGGALLCEDIAAGVVYALSQPANVNVADLLILPARSDVPGW